MQKQAGKKISAGIHTEQLGIEHVRQPGQWVPEFRPGGCKGPSDTFLIKAGLNGGIVEDVNMVIETNELMIGQVPVK